MRTSLRTKHSVAVLIRKGTEVLAIRRPDDDDELPGIWGLPAGTCRDRESSGDLVRRIGREKLSVDLVPLRVLASGSQVRETYSITMDLVECSMTGEPRCREWKWTPWSILEDGEAAGSLCCQLALRVGKGQ